MLKSDISNLSILDIQVLWLLGKKRLHGYGLLKELSKRRGKAFTSGTLYPLLQKFKKLGLVKAKKSGAREKTTYAITAKGRKALKAGCREFCVLFEDIFDMYMCAKCSGHLKKKVK